MVSSEYKSVLTWRQPTSHSLDFNVVNNTIFEKKNFDASKKIRYISGLTRLILILQRAKSQ